MINERPTHIDLFSGIGGFSLAAEEAGWQTTVFCENEPYCQKVLQQHWPEVPIVENIQEFDGNRHKGVSLCTGGFPCQGFSLAGEGRGCADDRYLWPEMFRVIKESSPRFVVAENVVGIISVALDTVLSDLESEGYSTGTVVLPACAVNAPHRRDRVWVLANTSKTGLQGPEQPGTPYESAGASRSTAQRGGFTGSDWSIEPNVGRVVDGLPNRSHRLKGLGNAIVPALCYEILKTIYECEQASKFELSAP